MRRSIHKTQWMGVAAVAATLSLTSSLLGQQAPAARKAAEGAKDTARQQRITANRPIDQDAATQNSDQAIATWLAIGNQEEIELGKLAASVAEHQKVKDFANMMIKEHSRALEQLARFGARNESLGENAGRRVGTDLRPQDVSGQPQLALRNQPGVDFLEVKRNIAQVCLANAKKEWTKRDGEKCDAAYVGQQIVAHQQMLSAQQVLREYASPELQALIDNEMQATQSHLHQAKQLMHEVAMIGHTSPSNREDRTRENRQGEKSR